MEIDVTKIPNLVGAGGLLNVAANGDVSLTNPITDVLLKANNLSDLANLATARINLDVYSIGAVDTIITSVPLKANDLSDLASIPTARTNLDVYSTIEVDDLLEPKAEIYEPTLGTLTGHTASSDEPWRAITNRAGFYVAVALDNVMTSVDGSTWITQTCPAGTWVDIIDNGSLFVAVGSDGTNRVMTSPDGITWTARTITADSWRSVTWNGNKFIAVSSDGTNRVSTSADGITWSGVLVTANEWFSVTSNPTTGLIVAVAKTGTNRVMNSVDNGATWTDYAAAEANDWKGIAYGDNLFVAISTNGANRVMTSVDGQIWTAVLVELNSWFGIGYGAGNGNGNGLYVATSTDGANLIMTSTDGAEWTPQTALEDNNLFDVTYYGGLFVILASTGVNRVLNSDLTYVGDTYKFDRVYNKNEADARFKPLDIGLQLPLKIDAVIGDTIQLFNQATNENPKFDNYTYVWESSVSPSESKSLKRYMETTATTSGDRIITLKVLGDNQEVLNTATSIMSVKENIEEPPKLLSLWNIGDSFINTPTSSDEFVRRLTGTGGTPTGDEYNNLEVIREGNSGKEWNWYVNNELSPFVYSGVVDFEQYRADNFLNIPDVAMLNLTWNGVGIPRTDAEWDVWDDDVYTFLDKIKLAFPSIEIKLVSPSMPSTNGGTGFVYGALGTGTYSDEYQLKVNCLRMAQIYDRITTELGYEYVQHIQTSLQVDSVYNVGATLTNVNTRNSLTQELIGNNGVHPISSGYYQIADAQYRNFVGNYCQASTTHINVLDGAFRDKIVFDVPLTLSEGKFIELEITTDNKVTSCYVIGNNSDPSNNYVLLTSTSFFCKDNSGNIISISVAEDFNTQYRTIRIVATGGNYEFYIDGILKGTSAIIDPFVFSQINGRHTGGFEVDASVKRFSLDGDTVKMQEGNGATLTGLGGSTSEITTINGGGITYINSTIWSTI